MNHKKFKWFVTFVVVLWVIMFAWYGLEVALCGAKMYSEVDSVLAAVISVLVTDSVVCKKDKDEEAIENN